MAIRDIYHDADTIQRSVQCGAWSNATLDDHLQQHARERGDKVAIVDRGWRLTFADLDRLARRVAGGLLHLGLTSGDVISIQTPNWAEWLIAHCAATKIGAVTNSIGAMYRHREVGYILDYAETALMLIPDMFRASRIPPCWPSSALARTPPPRRSDRGRVPRGMLSFRELLDTFLESSTHRQYFAGLRRFRPRGDPHVHLGTEANPKGVMHTHNTLDLATRHVKETYDLSTDDVVFMASPIGHTTALIVGARLPVMYGMTTVWQNTGTRKPRWS